MCGVLPPVFVCGFCGGQQLLVLPGAAPPAPAMPGANQAYAPVVQAQPNAPEHTLKGPLEKFAESFGTALGKGAVQAVFGQQQSGQQF
jgi:hypothetical protein